jgi:hypothetical protein
MQPPHNPDREPSVLRFALFVAVFWTAALGLFAWGCHALIW